MDRMTLVEKLKAIPWRAALQWGWPLPRMAGGSDQGASGADDAGGGGDDAGAGGGEGGGEPTSLDKLAQSFESFKTESFGRLDALSKRIPEPAAEADDDDAGADDAGYEFDFDEEDYGDDGDLTPEAQMRALQQMIQQAVAEAQRPQLEERAQERRIAKASALEEKYVKLQDDAFQDEMISKTIEFAKQIGQPALAREPELLEMVYLAHEAQQHGADEIPAGRERGVHLERTGAAGAGDEGDEDIEGDIAAAYRRGHHRLG